MLARDLKPVRVRRLHGLAIQYFLTLLCLGAASTAVLGTPGGGLARASRVDFSLALAVFALAAASGAILLAQYGRPGVKPSKSVQALFWMPLAGAVVLQGVRLLVETPAADWGPPVEHGWVCAAAALGVALAASAALLFEVRQQAPVKLARTARILLLASGAMAALVLQLHCPNNNPMHLALWHVVVPKGILAVSAGLMSRLALRW